MSRLPTTQSSYLIFSILSIAVLISISGCQSGSFLKGSTQPAQDSWIDLFDGQSLAGWKGLVGNPYSRAEMSPELLATAQSEADRTMRAHWSVQEGILTFDGKGSHLCTVTEYRDFVLELQWKIESGGDSGIYLRGCPQVQIWDIRQNPVGSGGLYNNQIAISEPLSAADRPPGEWNQFRIVMIDNKVTVELNQRQVVEAVPLENYWNRSLPLPATGQIELQSHGSRLQFRNIRIKPISFVNK